jgi:hypothetical protein
MLTTAVGPVVTVGHLTRALRPVDSELRQAASFGVGGVHDVHVDKFGKSTLVAGHRRVVPGWDQIRIHE